MDENEKKDLEEAVEKVINEREERKRLSMGKSPAPTEKKNSVKEVSSPAKKNKMKRVDLILAVIFISALLIFFGWPSIMPEETGPVTVYPANVVLASFDDGSNGLTTIIGGGWGWPLKSQPVDDYVSVSFELKNTGDEDAMDVSCFIKCCDQNGTILFAQLFTFSDIWADTPPGKIPISAIGSYRVPISNETLYVTHSIDVRWSPDGANTYVKLTEV